MEQNVRDIFQQLDIAANILKVKGAAFPKLTYDEKMVISNSPCHDDIVRSLIHIDYPLTVGEFEDIYMCGGNIPTDCAIAILERSPPTHVTAMLKFAIENVNPEFLEQIAGYAASRGVRISDTSRCVKSCKYTSNLNCIKALCESGVLKNSAKIAMIEINLALKNMEILDYLFTVTKISEYRRKKSFNFRISGLDDSSEKWMHYVCKLYAFHMTDIRRLKRYPALHKIAVKEGTIINN